jgi:hypothetical protein
MIFGLKNVPLIHQQAVTMAFREYLGVCLVVGIMLAQNPNKKCDQPIAHAFRFLNNVKKNYTITKRETFSMVYALHKLKHYLLGNKFVFYVNHVALMYFVKKPQLLGRITRWLLLFLEYDFLMVYKLRHSHLVVDAFSQLPNVIKKRKVFDRTTNASLFILQSEWLQEAHTYIFIKKNPNTCYLFGGWNQNPKPY